MNIGIDFDGVLFDTEKLFWVYTKAYNEKLKKNMIAPNEIRFQERFDWSEQEINDFMEKYMLEIQWKAPVMPLAKQVIQALSKKHKLFGITSRGGIDEKEIETTKQRLKKENIILDGVEFSNNKLETCKRLNIDIMIDDLFSTIKKLSENGIRCLYYQDLIKNDYKNENVTVVNNWADIFVEMKNLGIVDVEDLEF